MYRCTTKRAAFSILNPEGYFDVLQHKQKFTIWEDVKQDARSTSSVSYCMGTFYLSDWSNSGDTLADFSAVDAIGLLDGSPFDGGIYDTHPQQSSQRRSWQDTATPWTRVWPQSECRGTSPQGRAERPCSSSHLRSSRL